MTLYIDKTGTLGRKPCTTIRMEPDLWRGIAPEQAELEVGRLLSADPMATHEDEADATVISIGESHESTWLMPLVAARIVAELAGPATGATTRSLWVTSDEIRSASAICVHGGAGAKRGDRAPYARGCELAEGADAPRKG
ncbi:MAG: hypothetical protein OXC31_15635 [Spirochaetaceae bacterium]|nr:hypothetical protein [Spirochaetaceae bacterium]